MASPPSTPPKGCFAVFFGLWTLMGLAFFVFGFVVPAARIQAAKSWVETPCTVLESRLEIDTSSDSTSYSVGVRFEYEVEGTRHESERYKLSIVSGGRGSREQVIATLPAGLETVCYVNPEQPDQAVLNRDWGGVWIFGLIGLIFTLIGPGGYLLFSRAMDRKQRASKGRDVGEFLRSSLSESAQAMGAGERGAIDLVSATSHRTLLAMTGFMALMWNAMSWGFVSVKVLNEPWPPPLPLALFAGAFVTVGAALAGVFLYKLIGLFGPKVSAQLSEAHLHPGAEVQLEWRVTGGGLTKLVVQLEERRLELAGREENLVSETVRTEPVFEGDRKVNFERGSTTLHIPADAAPSFEKTRAARRWVLVLRGSIPLRPDMKQEFVLWVHEQA